MDTFNPVTVHKLKRMKAPFKRVMLVQLGTPMHRLPKSVTDINNLLIDYNEKQPMDVAKWYNVIVLGKLDGNASVPQDIQQQIDAAKQQLAATIKDTTVEEVIEKSSVIIKEQQQKAQTDLIRHAKEAITRAADHYRPIAIKVGKTKRKLKGVFPEEFPKMVQLASQRVPIMLVGPAGCGKTYIAGKIAEALGLDAYDQSCSEGISESTFTGWLLPVGNTGKFEYVPAPFITAYEKGGVFLLDEMDAADPNLLTFLNKAIANEHFFLPQRYKKPKIVKHKDFVAVAAANTYGAGADAQYVGRNALDAATLDRFRAGLITMDYSAPVEEALVDQDILVWGRKIRQKIKDHRLFRIMSTRVMLDLSKMKSAYDWDEDEWNDSYFADWTDEERRLVV